MYKTVVNPSMLYSLEIVALKKRQEPELDIAKMKILRFSLGVMRLDKIRNEHIRGTNSCWMFQEERGKTEMVWTYTENGL